MFITTNDHVYHRQHYRRHHRKHYRLDGAPGGRHRLLVLVQQRAARMSSQSINAGLGTLSIACIVSQGSPGQGTQRFCCSTFGQAGRDGTLTASRRPAETPRSRPGPAPEIAWQEPPSQPALFAIKPPLTGAMQPQPQSAMQPLTPHRMQPFATRHAAPPPSPPSLPGAA